MFRVPGFSFGPPSVDAEVVSDFIKPGNTCGKGFVPAQDQHSSCDNPFIKRLPDFRLERIVKVRKGKITTKDNLKGAVRHFQPDVLLLKSDASPILGSQTEISLMLLKRFFSPDCREFFQAAE